jgi:hypothetical protein
MADKRISQLVERVDIANNDVLPIVASGATTTNKVTISSIQTFMQGNLDLGVTSVGITLGTTGTDVNVSGSPITTSGNITINLPTASASNRGLLSSADWTTFNSKQPAGNYVTLDTTQTITAQKTFTTSGSSDTMIISHGSGSGFALDVIKAGSGEAIRVTKTSGSGNAMTISGGNFEAPTIVKTGGTSTQYLMADGSTSTLTNPITGTGASGQVAFWNGTSSQTGDNGLFWDNTNKRFGVGTTTPASNLEIIGGSGAGIRLTATAGTGNITVLKDNNFVSLRADGTSGFIAYGVTTAGSRDLRFVGNGTEVARFFTTGNLLLQNGGTFTDAGFRLDVNGSARVQGVLTGTANINGLTVSNNNSNPVIGSDGTNVLIGSNQPYRITFANNRINLNPTDGTNSIPSMSVSSLNSGSVFIGGNANPSAKLQVGGSITAATALAQGVFFNNTLVAAANNDVLVGLDVNPTFTNGAFTGVKNLGIRVGNSYGSYTSALAHGVELNTNVGISGTLDVGGDSSIIYLWRSGGRGNGSAIGCSWFSPSFGHLWFGTGPSTKQMILVQSTGNLLLNTTTDAGFRLDVNGTARVQGRFSLTTGQFLTVSGTVTNGLYAPNVDTLQIYNRNIPVSTIYSTGSESSFGIQIAYNSASTPPNNSTSILELTSTTKGFLPPRMTTVEKTAIASPATGLVVYDTTLNKLAVYTGAAWETITSL